MRRILTIISFLCLIVGKSNADTVPVEEAQSKAQSFFTSKVGGRTTKAVRVAPVRTRTASGTKNYYIFNREDGKGFVIISAESETREVLAYSDEGTFHTDMTGNGAYRFLDYYDRVINDLRTNKTRQSKTRAVSSLSAIKTSGKLLPTINLNQNGFYFNSSYAPQFGHSPCLAGCGPVAMAIVMAYHSWPQVPGLGSHSYTTKSNGLELSCDFSNQEPFNWNVINTASNKIERSNEISRLLRTCGISIEADYTPNWTSSTITYMAHALRDNFYYDYCTWLLRNPMTNDKEWNDIIMSEIDQDRPVIVAGQNVNKEEDRHIFVIDGYDSEGLYHYNLGWGGYNNGYYADGNISADNNYLCDEIMYGIKPRETAEDDNVVSILFKQICRVVWIPDPTTGRDYTVVNTAIKKGEYFNILIEYMHNATYEPLNGVLRLELRDKDGKYKCLIGNPGSAEGLMSNYFFSWFYFNTRIPSTVNLESTDRIYVSYSADRMNWQRLYCIDDEHSTVTIDPTTTGIDVPFDSEFAGSKPKYYDITGRRYSAPEHIKGIRIIKDGNGVRKVR